MLSPEQLEARQGLITSSIVAACAGLDEYTTPLQAKYKILGRHDDIGGKAAERGDILQEPVLRYPESQLGLVYEPAPFRLHQNGWAADSCDALYYRAPYVVGMDDPVLIGEGKTAALRTADGYGESGTDEIPITAWMQSHWHLIHWPEVDRCVVPVLIGGWEFYFDMYFVDRDPEIEGRLMESMAQWHRDYIIGDKDPPPCARDLDWIKKRYSESTNTELIASTPVIDQLHLDYWDAKEKAEAAETHLGNIRAMLETHIGHNAGTETSHGKITWKTTKSSLVVDWEELAKDLLSKSPQPVIDEIMKKFTRLRPGHRQFRVSRLKDGKK